MKHVHKWICSDCGELKGAPAPKAKRPKLKNAPGYDHPFDNCRLCQIYANDERRERWLRMAGMPFKSGIERFQNATLKSKEAIAKRLTNCACGHSADQHDRDALDNLLACSVCKADCDHFHYETETQEEAA